MKAITLYLGLDVHKDSITISIAPPGRQGEIRLHGTITNDLHALEKAAARELCGLIWALLRTQDCYGQSTGAAASQRLHSPAAPPL